MNIQKDGNELRDHSPFDVWMTKVAPMAKLVTILNYRACMSGIMFRYLFVGYRVLLLIGI